MTDNAEAYRYSMRSLCAEHGIKQRFIKPQEQPRPTSLLASTRRPLRDTRESSAAFELHNNDDDQVLPE